MTTSPAETTAEDVVHMLTPNDASRVNANGAAAAWVASCTCGEYTCKPQSDPVYARKEVYRHIRGVHRRRETAQQIEHDALGNQDGTLRSGLLAIIAMPGPVSKARLNALLDAHPEQTGSDLHPTDSAD